MTLTDRKGNIRGREFPTDTGIDGNACKETAKDQRWVGLYRQIPDTDTRPISVSLHLSPLSLAIHLSLALALSLFPFALSSPLVTRHPSIRPYNPFDRTHASQHSLPQNRRTTFRGTTSFPRWGSARAPFPVETTATAADTAPRPPSLTARCLMIPGTSKSTRPIPIR